MKQLLFFISFIMLFNYTNIITTPNAQKDITIYEGIERSLTLSGSYFIMKEFCRMFAHAPFINKQKINNAAIYCCKADHRSDSKSLWVLLMYLFDETPINELIDHIYHDSTDELTSFILQKHQELQLPCCDCREYNGYYIPEQSDI